MPLPDNNEIEPPPQTASNDITIGELLAVLARHPDEPLVFHYDGRAVRPGYHVTEVKAGQFSALDCGANPEAWSEIFIQLWDVNEGERVHLPSSRFTAIIGKVADHVSLDASAKLTFEVSDGVAPMQLHKATTPTEIDGRVHVELSPRAASCKPRDRWLGEQLRSQDSCCSSFGDNHQEAPGTPQ